jgi:peptidyl-prolyl cis-trans isomerase SurA
MQARRTLANLARHGMLLAVVCALCGPFAAAQTAAPAVLDRVVAVVNNQAILESDLENEMRLSVLEPRTRARGQETPQSALQRLISRTLIQQQIRQEDAQAITPDPNEIATRLGEMRRSLPACVHANCVTDAGWKEFLASRGLTEAEVNAYLERRIEILRFIERRFRQGILIDPSEVAAYYHDTLLPQYAIGETPPPLEQVSPRIEEVLLQQKVNALFSDWLENLRKQGEIEVLDPALEQTMSAAGAGAGGE